MKGIDLFCASPASTAICSSSDHRSMVRNGLHHHQHRRLPDPYKTFSNNLYNQHHSPSSRLGAAPCISELPFTPRLSSFRDKLSKPSTPYFRRKSSADVSDLRRDKSIHVRNSPPRGYSSRYLLEDSPFLDSLSSLEIDPKDSTTITSSSKKCMALVPSTPVVRSEERELTKSRSTGGAGSRLGSLMDPEKEYAKRKMMVKSYKQTEKISNYDDYGRINRQKSMGKSYSRNSTERDSAIVKSSPSASSRDQVVELRVSLHCKGCEGKLRKYLSKMEGVTSFSIDLETKKVTVRGNVTPLGVLTSISKVKNAQLWPSPMSSSSTSSSSSSNSSSSEFNY